MIEINKNLVLDKTNKPVAVLIEYEDWLKVEKFIQEFPGIEKSEKVAGGSACIAKTRIPVWTLEGLRREGLSESQILFDFPTLRAINLVNAWNYVSANQVEIDREIMENGSD